MKYRKTALIAITALATALMGSGCATTSAGIVSHEEDGIPRDGLVLADITLDSIYSYSEKKEEIESVAIASARRHGFDLRRSGEGDARELRLFFREKPFSRGFKSVTSLALLAEVSASGGEALYRVEFLHDGDESFDSLRYLSKALDAAFAMLRDEYDDAGKKAMKKSGT